MNKYEHGEFTKRLSKERRSLQTVSYSRRENSIEREFLNGKIEGLDTAYDILSKVLASGGQQ